MHGSPCGAHNEGTSHQTLKEALHCVLAERKTLSDAPPRAPDYNRDATGALAGAKVGASGFISTAFASSAVLSTAILPGRRMPGLSSAMRAKSPE